ncbi:MAG: EamA family transporter [Acidobacteriota bacterium]
MQKDFELPRRGYLLVGLAALLWAVSGSSAKFLFQGGLTPLQLVQVRVTLAAGLLLVWMVVKHPKLLRISRGDIIYFMALGAMMATVQFTYFMSISKIKVAAAILLEYLAPVFIAIHAAIFARESLNRPTVLAVVGATVGCYLVVGGYNLDLLQLNRVGVICGVISGLAFGGYSVYGERGMRTYHPWTVLFYALLFSAVPWNIAHPFWAPAPLPFEAFTRSYSLVEWGWILYIALLGTIVPYGLYLAGINLIRSTRASITATAEPILAGIISYIFLGESLDTLQLAGVALVIGSIIALQLKKEYDASTPDLIRARANATDPA